MTAEVAFITAGAPKKFDRSASLESECARLASLNLQDDDPSDGYRVVATYPATDYRDPGYRSAHARALNIRQGKVSYLTKYGRFDARARFIGTDMVGVFVKYLGPNDG